MCTYSLATYARKSHAHHDRPNSAPDEILPLRSVPYPRMNLVCDASSLRLREKSHSRHTSRGRRESAIRHKTLKRESIPHSVRRDFSITNWKTLKREQSLTLGTPRRTAPVSSVSSAPRGCFHRASGRCYPRTQSGEPQRAADYDGTRCPPAARERTPPRL